MEGESNLLRAHSQLATLTHAIKIREVTIDCGQTVMRFAGDLIGSFTFGMLATNDRLMGQTSADIMQGGAPRNQLLRVAFMCGQQGSDLTIMAIEQFGEIDVAQEGTLRMSLLTEANRFAAQTLLWFHSIKDGFEVLSGAEVENHRHQLRVAEALLKRWWIIKTDGQPNNLTVLDHVAWAQVLVDNFQDHVGAELPDTLAAEAREVLGNAVRKRVFQAFFPHWAVTFAKVIG